MRAFQCPSCGAPVEFHSPGAVFAVCEHCRSMVVRNDASLEAIGTMAELPPDVSPLQIGSTGAWRDRAFTLRGRLRLEWSEGRWTEWYVEFADGQHGWLAETQGFYTVSLDQGELEGLTSISELHASAEVQLLDLTWKIVDRKEVAYVFAEGELPFVARPGATRLSLDLAAADGRFGTLEQSDDGVEFYAGEYAAFDALKFQNLRAIPGWTPGARAEASRAARRVNCPHCGAPVELHAAGLTLAVVCGSCRSILDPGDKDVAIVQRAESVQRELQPALPLGGRGEFDGHPYEVIGYVVRGDASSAWSEYLLFNPWQGFLWLVTYEGHWTLVRRVLDEPNSAGGRSAAWRGKRFELFVQGATTVQAVLGEFYWRVQRGEKTLVADYINPPEVLSSEKYPELDEETWSWGEYRSPKEIERAFNLASRLPPARGPYLNEPNPYRERMPRILRAAFAALVLVVGLELYFVFTRPDQRLTSADYDFTPISSMSAASPLTFTLRGRPQPVHVEATAPGLQNSWVDLDYELVNTGTSETRQGATELSYYSGYDSDGAWSEGSRRRDVDFAAVPAGDYVLRIESSQDPKLAHVPVRVEVHAGGLFYTNFLLCLALIAAYPVWVVVQRFRFETRRWQESDFPRLGTD